MKNLSYNVWIASLLTVKKRLINESIKPYTLLSALCRFKNFSSFQKSKSYIHFVKKVTNATAQFWSYATER